MCGTPDVLLACELVQCGIRKVVSSASEPGSDWDLAAGILDKAGVEISANWKND